VQLTPVQRARLHACLHPLRLRILDAISRVPGSSLSLARRLGDSQPRVHYHLRCLARAGLARVVEERRKRGVVERLYAAEPEAATTVTQALGVSENPEAPLAAFCATLAREGSPRETDELTVTGLHTLRLSRREARHLHEDILMRVRELQARHAGAGRDYRVAWTLFPRPA
jgi:DNA-binding transcriptional ArsR family regulator